MPILSDEIWLHHAVAKSHDAELADSIVLFEGSLEQVVDAICELPADDQKRITISLPDRVSEPFGFGAEMIPVLAREWLGS